MIQVDNNQNMKQNNVRHYVEKMLLTQQPTEPLKFYYEKSQVWAFANVE